MKRDKKLIKGFGDPVTLGIIALVVVVFVLLLYFGLGRGLVRKESPQVPAVQEQAEPTISASDELDVMEDELDAIDPGSFEGDIQNMETEAQSL